jgi:hypothetical protein
MRQGNPILVYARAWCSRSLNFATAAGPACILLCLWAALLCGWAALLCVVSRGAQNAPPQHVHADVIG